MKKILKAVSAIGAVIGLLSATPAKAEDRANWTGLYVGGQLGAGSTKTDAHLIQNDRDFSANATGAFGGGYIGYSQKLSSMFVAALEAEGNFSDISNSGLNCTIAGPAVCGSKVSSFGSLRGRAGVLLSDNVLLYGAAGWGVARMNFSRDFTLLPGLNSGVSDTRSGLVLAIGAEAALAKNWNMRFEFDRYEFGTKTYGVGALSDVSDTQVKPRLNTARIGLSYTFGR